MKTCIIMRGAPGSGKSFLAKHIALNHRGFSAQICSADHFFMIPKDEENPGSPRVYRYDPTKIGLAHMTCQREADRAMGNGVELVIIDNTNISRIEYATYVGLAYLHGYKVEYAEPITPWWTATRHAMRYVPHTLEDFAHILANKTTHGVPWETIHSMLMRWEENP